jgi:hypothetical protein
MKTGPGRRPPRNVSEPADSVRQVASLHPTTVTDDLRRIAGGNRLAACEPLGCSKTPAVVMKPGRLRAEFAGIDEDLTRNGLTVLERSEQLARRKVIRA